MHYEYQEAVSRIAKQFRQLRQERGISQRQTGDAVGLNHSVVSRAEIGRLDARLSTWARLFQGLGYLLLFDAVELSEEADGMLLEERDRRLERQLEGLASAKRRYWAWPFDSPGPKR